MRGAVPLHARAPTLTSQCRLAEYPPLREPECRRERPEERVVEREVGVRLQAGHSLQDLLPRRAPAQPPVRRRVEHALPEVVKRLAGKDIIHPSLQRVFVWRDVCEPAHDPRHVVPVVEHPAEDEECRQDGAHDRDCEHEVGHERPHEHAQALAPHEKGEVDPHEGHEPAAVVVEPREPVRRKGGQHRHGEHERELREERGGGVCGGGVHAILLLLAQRRDVEDHRRQRAARHVARYGHAPARGEHEALHLLLLLLQLQVDEAEDYGHLQVQHAPADVRRGVAHVHQRRAPRDDGNLREEPCGVCTRPHLHWRVFLRRAGRDVVLLARPPPLPRVQHLVHGSLVPEVGVCLVEKEVCGVVVLGARLTQRLEVARRGARLAQVRHPAAGKEAYAVEGEEDAGRRLVHGCGDRDALLARQLGELAHDPRGSGGVQAGCGLVQEHDWRGLEQLDSDGEAPALPA
mmetsp:Transcript_9314/g.32368  ORF Transcript_9314/g.32368 Transcript_9314/m.32368 type:complete len:461 (+) Transcript_9314:97-1479(+)